VRRSAEGEAVSGPTEAEIQNRIFLDYGREPDVTLWRNNTGQAKAEVVTRKHLERLLGFVTMPYKEGNVSYAAELIRALLKEPQRFTRYGLAKGSSDIIGIVQTRQRTGPRGEPENLHGVFLALEVKAERGVVSAEQQMFLDIVNRRGGIGRVVRSSEEAGAAINEARAL
jgi:hypothetical protein